MSVASDYYYISGDPTVPETCRVYKTVQIDSRVMLDLNEAGSIIGVESLFGLVDFEDLVRVLQTIKVC